MKLRHLGICGIVSLLSYTAMAVFGLFERLSALRRWHSTRYWGYIS